MNEDENERIIMNAHNIISNVASANLRVAISWRINVFSIACRGCFLAARIPVCIQKPTVHDTYRTHLNIIQRNTRRRIKRNRPTRVWRFCIILIVRNYQNSRGRSRKTRFSFRWRKRVTGEKLPRIGVFLGVVVGRILTNECGSTDSLFDNFGREERIPGSQNDAMS
jgi:hypothetical protein